MVDQRATRFMYDVGVNLVANLIAAAILYGVAVAAGILPFNTVILSVGIGALSLAPVGGLALAYSNEGKQMQPYLAGTCFVLGGAAAVTRFLWLPEARNDVGELWFYSITGTVLVLVGIVWFLVAIMWPDQLVLPSRCRPEPPPLEEEQ